MHWYHNLGTYIFLLWDLQGLEQALVSQFMYIYLLAMGFTNSRINSALFLKGSSLVDYTCLRRCLDEILIVGVETYLIDKLVIDLNLKFALKDQGTMHYFLGVEVSNASNAFHLSQSKSMNNLLEATGLMDRNEFL